MRVLITGVAGHLGSRLAQWIKDHQPGAEIYGIDDLSCGYWENVPVRGLAWFTKGAVDGGTLPTLLKQTVFDVVFHFAAYAAECMSPFLRAYNYHNNLVETSRLVTLLIDRGFKGRLVFASSIAVYGKQPCPISETSAVCPHDPYGVAKLACEHDIKIAGHQHGLDWCIVRPHNVYGPYQSLWQRYRNVLGLWMRATLEGKPIVIFGDGEQRRAFTYIDDIVPALWAAGTLPGATRQTINLGGATPTAINALAKTFNEVTGGQLIIDHYAARHEVKDAWATTRLSEAVLGYKDHTPLYNGIESMWDWAKDAWARFPDRRQDKPLPIETRVGMPAAWL